MCKAVGSWVGLLYSAPMIYILRPEDTERCNGSFFAPLLLSTSPLLWEQEQMHIFQRLRCSREGPNQKTTLSLYFSHSFFFLYAQTKPAVVTVRGRACEKI